MSSVFSRKITMSTFSGRLTGDGTPWEAPPRRAAPGAAPLPVVRLLDRGVEDADGGAPDVGAGAVALDERDDRVVGHAELAVVDRDLLAPGDLHLASHYFLSPR